MAEFGTLRRLRKGNGAEYTANIFKDYCRDSRIKQEFTVPETPQHNEVAERFNRTVVEIGRSLLIQAKLPKNYWVRALSTAAHIRISPRRQPVAVKGRAPLNSSLENHIDATIFVFLAAPHML